MWATAIVMPRAFSSGALSMESKLRNLTFGLFFPRTLVMAAVRVVLPWSMCPIVPILTCGLLRSNFSFDIFRPSPYYFEIPCTLLTISSANEAGTSSYFPKCIVKLPRPCVRERSSVAYPNISDRGTDDLMICVVPRNSMPSMRPRREFRRSEEHTSELQSRRELVCRLLLEKKHTVVG